MHHVWVKYVQVYVHVGKLPLSGVVTDLKGIPRLYSLAGPSGYGNIRLLAFRMPSISPYLHLPNRKSRKTYTQRAYLCTDTTKHTFRFDKTLQFKHNFSCSLSQSDVLTLSLAAIRVALFLSLVRLLFLTRFWMLSVGACSSYTWYLCS